nr:MAG TPA: hypothetical protein [Caudoviricetes sp.]
MKRIREQTCQKRLFQCDVCGAITPATKMRHRGATLPGHRKTMYCFFCKKRTDFTQIE